MLVSRRELCTRALKRCRASAEQQQKTCAASTCASPSCSLRLSSDQQQRQQQADLVCCQWPSFQGTPMLVSQPLAITVHHSQRRREQQGAMLSAWKEAMQRSDQLQWQRETERQQQQQSMGGGAGSGEGAATTATSPRKECQLPLDMECGCKTKREKEEMEAQALAAARAKQTQAQTQVAAVREQQMRHHQQQEAQAVRSSPSTTRKGVEVINSATAVTGQSVEMQTSFHRRHLPQDCIAFSSVEGRQLFVEALNSRENHMQIYFPLAEQFITQAEPAYCGLSTLAMCLNALQIDPGRLWKGAWRWFSEELFDCCTSLHVAKEKGISMSEFICLARCNGVQTSDVRADPKTFSLAQFRDVVKKSCATSNEIVVLNYSRKALGQTGDGHFSPIGGYHEERDMVLLLDVARFKYPPHWVKLSLVHAAMQRVDAASGQPRGLVILKEGAHATGPTLVKNMVLSTDPSVAVKPAPTVCCSSAIAVESARHVTGATSTSA